MESIKNIRNIIDIFIDKDNLHIQPYEGLLVLVVNNNDPSNDSNCIYHYLRLNTYVRISKMDINNNYFQCVGRANEQKEIEIRRIYEFRNDMIERYLSINNNISISSCRITLKGIIDTELKNFDDYNR